MGLWQRDARESLALLGALPGDIVAQLWVAFVGEA
jgi:hypothetical protein